jgi:hypothetical protein
MALMKWCKPDTKCTHDLISFAIGSRLVTLALCFIRYWYNVFKYKLTVKAYTNLPSFHIRTMWLLEEFQVLCEVLGISSV